MSSPSTYCPDCTICNQTGMQQAIRGARRVALAVRTVGISELVVARRRRCDQCGHTLRRHRT